MEGGWETSKKGSPWSNRSAGTAFSMLFNRSEIRFPDTARV